MKPTGAEAVKAALIEAATGLFAERGPANVSIRQIAAEAGVNHGLVHRHFGSKEALLGAVMERSSRSIADSLGAATQDEILEQLLPRVFAASKAERTYWQILARMVLDGLDPRDFQATHPVVTRILHAARRQGLGTETELVTALIVAAGLGLLMFEPFLRAATGLDAQTWTRLERTLPTTLSNLLPRVS